MVIVGLTGNIGSGKTTFGSYLGEASGSHEHGESSDVIIEVANAWRTVSHPISQELMAVNDWLAQIKPILKHLARAEVDSEHLTLSTKKLAEKADHFDKLLEYLNQVQNGQLHASELIESSNKDIYRPLLQWIGGYFAKVIDGELWFKELLRRYGKSEIELLTLGGVRFPADANCIKKAGGYIVKIERPSIEELDPGDLTEREKSLIEPDIIVQNDGSLDDLKQAAANLWEALKKEQLAMFPNKP